jgi:uncharacterized paraquat-inducible protein A
MRMRLTARDGHGILAGVASIPVQRCPRCGEALPDIKGSRIAVCRRCGYKDDCC